MKGPTQLWNFSQISDIRERRDSYLSTYPIGLDRNRPAANALGRRTTDVDRGRAKIGRGRRALSSIDTRTKSPSCTVIMASFLCVAPSLTYASLPWSVSGSGARQNMGSTSIFAGSTGPAGAQGDAGRTLQSGDVGVVTP